MKKCVSCSEVKPLGDFMYAPYSTFPDSYTVKCQKCLDAWVQEYGRKTCVECGVEQNNRNFDKDGRTRDGLSNTCNPCRDERWKEKSQKISQTLAP